MLLFDIFKIKNHEKFKYHIIYFPVFSFWIADAMKDCVNFYESAFKLPLKKVSI
jgi:hypothetical protein